MNGTLSGLGYNMLWNWYKYFYLAVVLLKIWIPEKEVNLGFKWMNLHSKKRKKKIGLTFNYRLRNSEYYWLRICKKKMLTHRMVDNIMKSFNVNKWTLWKGKWKSDVMITKSCSILIPWWWITFIYIFKKYFYLVEFKKTIVGVLLN